MKSTIFVLCTTLCICASASADAGKSNPATFPGDPIEGYFATYDGSLHGARITESWLGDSLGMFVPGNVITILSWEGAGFSGQWNVRDVVVGEQGAVETGRGTGGGEFSYIDYHVECEGGLFSLDNTHFSDGITDLSGWINYFAIDVRITFEGEVMIFIACNFNFNGRFFNCPRCFLETEIANAANWDYGPDPMPEGYPPFVEGAESGRHFLAPSVLIHILCEGDPPHCGQVIGGETSTWGRIKSIYK